MNGAAPGPAPAAQLRASNSRLTRSSWRTWPQRKLRRKVPSVDGALTVHPARSPSRLSATHRRRRCSRRPRAPRRPGSAACRRRSPAPARHRGRRSCRRALANRDARRAWRGGAAPHRPPGGGRRRRCLSGRGRSLVASNGCSLWLGRDSYKTIVPATAEHPTATARALSFGGSGPREHPYPSRDSCVFYRDAFMTSVEILRVGMENLTYRADDPLSSELLDRGRQGARDSRLTAATVKAAIRPRPPRR